MGHVKSKVHRKWMKKDGREEESDKVREKLRERERERERESKEDRERRHIIIHKLFITKL